MSFRLRASHYKTLSHFDWEPSGVCALVGPNGSGKTTALWTPEVLRLALEADLVHALTQVGGAGDVRTFSAPANEPTEVTISVGDVSWTVRPERASRVWERVHLGSDVILEREPGSEDVLIGRDPHARKKLGANLKMGLQRAADGDALIAQQASPLLKLVRGYRVYGDYELRVLREQGSPQSNDLQMNATGTNVFSVLQRWRDQSDYEHRWQFVIEHLREFFPGFFRTFDFEPAGNVISLVVRSPHKHALRPNDWPNGFFASLLNLTAIAGSDDGGAVALDEPETALHPSLIRACVDTFRDWAISHGTTILLATHSPVVLDCFTEQPDRVFVMEGGHPSLPVRLDALRKRDWLRHFSLGELYEHEKFGAPRSGNGM